MEKKISLTQEYIKGFNEALELAEKIARANGHGNPESGNDCASDVIALRIRAKKIKEGGVYPT